jgi:enterochelin esterase-like enzyme
VPFAHLSIISPGFLAVLAVLAGLVWSGLALGALRRHRKPPRQGRHLRGRAVTVLGLLSALLLSLAGAADGVNAHFAYLPRVGDLLMTGAWPTARLSAALDVDRAADTHPKGAVVSLPVPGIASGLRFPGADVYLPPQYFTEPERRFPVMYLLHGSPGVPADWLRGGDAAGAALAVATAGRPVVVVIPHVSRWWLDDPECVNGAREHVETYVTGDVVRAVDSSLRTLRSSADRTVAGMSAGGYCALNLGLRHRDEFGLIVDMSGLDRPTHRGGMPALFGRRPDLAAVVRKNSPVDYVPAMAAEPRTRIWLDVGTHDREVLPQMVVMDRLLAARGLPVELHLRPGSHTFRVWKPALAQSLIWAADAMPQQQQPPQQPAQPPGQLLETPDVTALAVSARTGASPATTSRTG